MQQRKQALEALAQRLGHQFTDIALLDRALCHSSMGGSVEGKQGSNERLEFLGDRVLGLVIADSLSKRFREEEEGALAARLAVLASGAHCTKVARSFGLDNLLLYVGNQPTDKMLGDCCEAVIAALYLDGGLLVAQQFILRAWEDALAQKVAAPRHAKSLLQEYVMQQGFPRPRYEVLSRSGPDHAPEFLVKVSVLGLGAAEGQATLRKAAETAAAEQLLTQLQDKAKNDDNDDNA